MTKAERIAKYGLERYEQLVERIKARIKERYHNDPEYRESVKARNKAHLRELYHNDPEYRESVKVCNARNAEYQREYQRKYKKVNLNSNGKTKNYIRIRSNQILFKQRKHARLKGYEIHHCFGYDDPSRFIYIPRDLHRAIHRILRDNNIDADSNHYKYIVNLINECTEYTYVSA